MALLPTPTSTRPDCDRGALHAAPGKRGEVSSPNDKSMRIRMQSGADRWQRALYMPLAILAWLAVLVVVGWLLGYVTKTILMIALAGVLAFALAPLAKFLARWLPELVAIGLAYALGIAVVVGLGAFIVATVTGQITSLVTNLPIYAQQTQAYEPRLLDWLG